MTDCSFSEISTFSPEGRLYQIEHTTQATKLGSTGIGIKSNCYISLAVERKKNSNLNENKIIEKIITLNSSTVCCVSGLTSDGRICVEKIRNFLENNLFLFEETGNTEKCTRELSHLILNVISGENGEFQINRPLAVSFLVCGFDRDGIHLFSVDPAGNFTEEKIATIGNGSNDASFLAREGFRKKMTRDESVKLGLKSIKITGENNMEEKNIEMRLLDNKGFNNL